MSFEQRTVIELQSVLASGGSLRISAAGRSLLELQALAASASTGGSRLTIFGVDHISTIGLKAVAAAGNGSVAFE